MNEYFTADLIELERLYGMSLSPDTGPIAPPTALEAIAQRSWATLPHTKTQPVDYRGMFNLA
jgi:hypothetical protein